MKTKPRKNGASPIRPFWRTLSGGFVAAAEPEKIVLFGSAARGEMGPDSDYDLLVIKRGKFNFWRLMTKIQEHLSGKEAAA